MYGYQGQFLHVDLDARQTRHMPLAEGDLRSFVGGSSLAAKLIYDRIKSDLDPLSPESPLVLATGPLTGTGIPMASRYAVCGISPLTGYWGEATSGGMFPFHLKCAGYDGILISGRSRDPIYVYVGSGVAEIRDANQLWGKNIYETQELIRGQLSGGRVSVACIGQAGERLNRHACVMNDRGRAAGRCGLGALMGSKNLKAVVAGGNSRPQVADKDRVKELVKESHDTIRKGTMTPGLREYGTLMYADMGMSIGDMPAKYFAKSVFPVEKVTGQALRQAYAMEQYACHGCPVGCGREVKDFRPDLPSIDGPEYETVGVFGPLCMNFDLESIVAANHLCNAAGIDTISTGVSIAYAMYLAEQGVLEGKEETDLDIKWGDGKAIIRLVEMIIKQEGIGKLISEGTLRMARQLGRDDGEAAQVKGLEIPMHDPRAFHGQALSYATGPRGACHLKGDYYSIDLGGSVAELGIRPSQRLSSEAKAEQVAKYQSIKDLYDSLPLCKFASLSLTQISQILSAVTGWDYTPQDMLVVGDRSINIKRAISNRLGLTRDDDKLPRICLEALEEGRTKGVVPDMDRLLREYYEHRQWNWETGRPQKEKLIELGLDQVAGDLYGEPSSPSGPNL